MLAWHAAVVLMLEAVAGTSHYGRAPKLTSVVPSYKARTDRNQRRTARACSKLARWASGPETASESALRETRRLWFGVREEAQHTSLLRARAAPRWLWAVRAP